MTYASGIKQYQQVNAASAAYSDPHQQVQMLMDGAVQRILQAKAALARMPQLDAVAEKGDRISKAVSIVAGLQACLDRAEGGEVAANLDRLYDYMQRRLVEANLSNDESVLDEVCGLLREIRSAWSQIPPELRAPQGAPAENGATG